MSKMYIYVPVPIEVYTIFGLMERNLPHIINKAFIIYIIIYINMLFIKIMLHSVYDFLNVLFIQN